MKITGHVQVEHYSPDGELLAVRESRNLIVNEGLNLATQLLAGNNYALNTIYLSEEQTAPDAGDTWANSGPAIGDLGAVTVSGNAVIVDATMGPYGAPQPTYYSLLLGHYDPVPHLLFARAYVGAINLQANDSLRVVWTVTIT